MDSTSGYLERFWVYIGTLNNRQTLPEHKK